MNEYESIIINRIRQSKYYALVKHDYINTFLFLAPYQPFIYPSNILTIDSYYIVSNHTYQTERDIINALNKQICLNNSLDYEKIFIKRENDNGCCMGSSLFAQKHIGHNLRMLANKSSLGKIAKNGFLYNDEYGTYCYIGAFDLPDNISISLESLPKIENECDNCNNCTECCPTNAIGTDKWGCIRSIQECAHKGLSPLQTNLSNNLNSSLLGCNLCQNSCSLNRHIKATLPPKELTDILQKITQNDYTKEDIKALGNMIMAEMEC